MSDKLVVAHLSTLMASTIIYQAFVAESFYVLFSEGEGFYGVGMDWRKFNFAIK
jgi:hypothetical protein